MPRIQQGFWSDYKTSSKSGPAFLALLAHLDFPLSPASALKRSLNHHIIHSTTKHCSVYKCFWKIIGIMWIQNFISEKRLKDYSNIPYVSTEQLNRKIFLSYFSYVTFPLVPFQKIHAEGQSQCCLSICGFFKHKVCVL